MTAEASLTCRELEEVSREDCCPLCHEEEEMGWHRMRPVRLADGREAMVCHGARKVLEEKGLSREDPES